MSVLLKYLEGNFAESIENIQDHFWNKFGVRVRIEDDLFQFKYHQLEGKFQEPVTHECRGHIVRRTDSRWRLVSRPFDKFFGMNTGYCPVHNKSDFEARVANLHLAEKADGTCIQMWHDGTRWRVSTLGTINTELVQQSGQTVEELFRSVVGDPFLGPFKDHTLLFELCCPENQIITKYHNRRVYLIGIRNIETGEYLDSTGDPFSNSHYIKIPEMLSLSDANITSRDDLFLYVEKQSTNEDLGSWPEGFVLYENGRPVAKLKNRRYLQRLAVNGAQNPEAKDDALKSAAKRVTEAYFTGSLDDLHSFLTPELQVHADAVKLEAGKLVAEAGNAIDLIATQNIDPDDRKAFAIAVNLNVDGRFRAFFFSNKKLMAMPAEAKAAFADWLILNHSRFRF